MDYYGITSSRHYVITGVSHPSSLARMVLPRPSVTLKGDKGGAGKEGDYYVIT